MITEVIKGVDDQIEFKGFKGRYFTRLAIFVVGLIFLTLFLYALGLKSFWFFLIALGIGVAGYFYIQMEMQKNQKYGHIHAKHNAPEAIIQDKPFHKFL